jgi:hypothetical protein
VRALGSAPHPPLFSRPIDNYGQALPSKIDRTDAASAMHTLNALIMLIIRQSVRVRSPIQSPTVVAMIARTFVPIIVMMIAVSLLV